MKFWITALIALQMIAFSPRGFAFESDEGFGYHHEDDFDHETIEPSVNQNDATRVQKFDAALEALGIPQEPAPNFNDFVHANESSESDVKKILPYIDPDLGLSRYLSLAKGNLMLFRDFFKSMISLNYLEYQQSLSTENPSNDSSELMSRLKAVAAQAGTTYPLAGLKVLVDPGHMGGSTWDGLTGKYVSVNGKRVSEGNLNLWTALLVAQKLERLGATVKLTREKVGAVSTENYKTFDTTPYIQYYFQSSMDDWMAPYLTKPIDEVKKAILNAPQVKKAYSDAQRLQYFIGGADLEARSKMVDAFNPDVVLDIHYDASDNTKTQNTKQSLEAFVPGAFLQNETGGRKLKALALKHLLEVRRWNQSVELADHVTQSMSDALKIPRLNVEKAYFSPPAYAQRVRDGVYARNLYISRRALTSLVVYLECMHYDHVKEFKRLAMRDKMGFYHSTAFQYPSRLDTISKSITNGFLSYFSNLKL